MSSNIVESFGGRRNASVWTAASNDYYVDPALCVNDKVVYMRTDDALNLTYFLHLHTFRQSAEDEQGSGQWVISATVDGDVEDAVSLAFCHSTDLYECGAGSWYVLRSDDDTVTLEVDESTTVSFDQCESTANAMDAASETNVATIVAVVLLTVAVVCFGLYLFYRNRARKLGHVEFQDQEEVEVEMEMDQDTQDNINTEKQF